MWSSVKVSNYDGEEKVIILDNHRREISVGCSFEAILTEIFAPETSLQIESRGIPLTVIPQIPKLVGSLLKT